MACNYQGKIVTNGLVLCLDAADKKSYPGTGTVWTDRSGSGNHGTSSNLSNFVRNDQKSLYFNSTYVNLALNPSLFTTQATLIIFLKLTVAISVTGGGIERVSGGGSKAFSHYTWGDGLAYFGTFLNQTKRVNSIVLSSVIDRTNWHMISITCSPGANNWKFYQNTELIRSDTGDSNISLSTDSVYSIGGDTNYRMQGDISNILMYNKALTTDEIKQNFSILKGRFGI
jgi:hypothetical protein